MSPNDHSPISAKMTAFMERASWIRRMFEEGARLKTQYGADRVCDFSLGNPDLSPPESFRCALQAKAADRSAGIHGYMSNAGLPEVRSRVAARAGRDHGVDIGAEEILMSCGAAGGLNIIFKSILDPGDEVIVPTPYFVEYGFYVDNHGGTLVAVPSRPDFSLDIAAIDNALTERTKAVLINSPNNPSGVVYSDAEIEALSALLDRAGRDLGRPVYLISDEPYRRLVFDGVTVPPILRHYTEAIVATSFSKDLSIPGERVGYVAVHPKTPYKASLLGALTLANRILGFVNAPALMQRAVADCLDSSVDVVIYQRRRDLLAAILRRSGYDFFLPQGAFYFFPRSPIPDDTAFIRILKDELILAVPGTGFGAPGHFRMAFCVDDRVIERAEEGLLRAMEKARGPRG